MGSENSKEGCEKCMETCNKKCSCSCHETTSEFEEEAWWYPEKKSYVEDAGAPCNENTGYIEDAGSACHERPNYVEDANSACSENTANIEDVVSACVTCMDFMTSLWEFLQACTECVSQM